MPYQFISDRFAYAAARKEQKRVGAIVDLRREVASSFFDKAGWLQKEARVKGYPNLGAVVDQALRLTDYSSTARDFVAETALKVAGSSKRQGTWSVVERYQALQQLVSPLYMNPDQSTVLDDMLALSTKLTSGHIDFAACALKIAADRCYSDHRDDRLKISQAIAGLEQSYQYQRLELGTGKRMLAAAQVLALLKADHDKTAGYRLDIKGATAILLDRQTDGFKDGAPHHALFLPHDRVGGNRGVVIPGSNRRELASFSEPVSFRDYCTTLAVELLRMPAGAIRRIDELQINKMTYAYDISVGGTGSNHYKIGELFVSPDREKPPTDEEVLAYANDVLESRRAKAIDELARLQGIAKMNSHWENAFADVLGDINPRAAEPLVLGRMDAVLHPSVK